MNASNASDDMIRLRHMLGAAREVVSFTGGATREDLDTNIMLFRALSMSAGIIGEAASRVSQDFRDAHPQIPWKQVIGMRNFLFHAYFKVDKDILWDTALDAIPALVAELEKVLPPEDEGT